MWKQLPVHGKPLGEVRIEGTGKSRDVIIVPKTGERIRFPAAEEIAVETVGHVLIRTTPIDTTSVRVVFSGAGDLRLDRAEVAWPGSEEAWNDLWRRARMRSTPWWREDEQEIELDWVLETRLTIACAARTEEDRMIRQDKGAFETILAPRSPAVRKLALRIRALVLDVLPEVFEVVWKQQKIAGYGTGPKKLTEHFCWIAPATAHVSLGFNYGAELPDPAHLLEGTGRLFRHVKLASEDDLAQKAVRNLLLAATRHRVPKPLPLESAKPKPKPKKKTAKVRAR